MTIVAHGHARSAVAALAALLVSAGATVAVAQDRDPADVTRPAGTTPFQGAAAELEALGETLFSDASLSPNGTTCNACHADFGAYSASFAKPYPHEVGMASSMFGLGPVDAETMVQLCMVVPMGAKPLAWESRELAALTAYVLAVQPRFAAKSP